MSFPTRITGLAAAAALAAVLAGCSGSDEPQPTTSSPTTEEPSATEQPSASRSPRQSPSGSPTATPTEEPGATVPAYFAGDTPQGPRLFREFQRVGGDPLLSAARLVAGGTPLDPDYRTLWPTVEIESVQPTDGLLLVTLADDGFTSRPDGMSELDARTALQQMVYTLQGVQQERVPIVIKRGGTDFRLLGLPTDQQYEQASALETLNLVSITSPVEGATVTGDTVKVSGVANSFEANVPLQLEPAGGGAPVWQGSAMAGWVEEKLFPFSTTIDVSDLPAGRYVLVAMTDDPSGGTEGPGPFRDTKAIEIR